MKQQIIPFKDLYVSSYLKAKAHPLHDATIDNGRRTTFTFIETPEVTKDLKEYYSGTALVNPATFIESFKSLRSLAYSLSDKINIKGERINEESRQR
jgi:hypothetical protein